MVVAAGVIVIVDGRILAFERFDRPGFSLPCGHVDPGETPARAALREAEEETGLVLALSDVPPFVAVDPLGGKLVHTFLATVTGGALRDDVPGEGRPCWASLEQVAAGPYADYNRRAFAHFGLAGY